MTVAELLALINEIPGEVEATDLDTATSRVRAYMREHDEVDGAYEALQEKVEYVTDGYGPERLDAWANLGGALEFAECVDYPGIVRYIRDNRLLCGSTTPTPSEVARVIEEMIF